MAAAGELNEQYRRDGFTSMRGLVSSESLRAVHSEYDAIKGALTERPPPKDQPFVLFWTQVKGAVEPRLALSEVPRLRELVMESEVTKAARAMLGGPLRLYEVIFFSKPPDESETLHWHQDNSYLPLERPDLITAWVPLYRVTRQTGALHYVPGSHKLGERGIVDLYTGGPVDQEDRELIPSDVEAAGFQDVCCEVDPGDVLFHDGYTWHMSGPNLGSPDSNHRLAISIRYALDPIVYRPHPANAGLSSRFAHANFRVGEAISGPSFPLIG